jgi:hypothetical protein
VVGKKPLCGYAESPRRHRLCLTRDVCNVCLQVMLSLWCWEDEIAKASDGKFRFPIRIIATSSHCLQKFKLRSTSNNITTPKQLPIMAAPADRDVLISQFCSFTQAGPEEVRQVAVLMRLHGSRRSEATYNSSETYLLTYHHRRRTC